MNTEQVITLASKHLATLGGHVFDVLSLTKPTSQDAAVNLGKIISKLSPLLGNLIEFNTVDFLNAKDEFKRGGRWVRQDPGFPDAVYVGSVTPTPGFEIQAWFPLATEITARFKDSQNAFRADNTYVAMLAWLPEYLVYGRPYILDVCVVSGKSVAEARDTHYHNPPDYLVLEPGDTTERTANLQQTNTLGYKWQGSQAQFAQAEKVVASWGKGGRKYKPTVAYQSQVQELMASYSYRLDTNYAKMDRIVHADVEAFKAKVYEMKVNGLTVKEWQKLIVSKDDTKLREALAKHLGVR